MFTLKFQRNFYFVEFSARLFLRSLIMTTQFLPDKTSSPENQTNSETGSCSSGAENGSMTSSSNSYVTKKEAGSNDEVCFCFFNISLYNKFS